MVEQNELTELNLTPELKCTPTFINPCVIAVDYVYIRAILKYSGHIIYAAGTITIIRVQPSNNVATRLCKTLIQRVALAVIRL
jgi:hypothetical protein